MTGNNRKEIIRVFFITVFLFAAVLAFFYAARVNITPHRLSVQEAKGGAAPAVFQDGATAHVKIGDILVIAETAQSGLKKARGLSGRASLSEDEGMLFVFEEKGAYSFWNKDMRVPLDVIWIDGDRVVDISENLPAFAGAPVVLTSSVKGNLVLEVNAGFVKTHGIRKGDRVVIY